MEVDVWWSYMIFTRIKLNMRVRVSILWGDLLSS